MEKSGLYLAPIFCDGVILQRDAENKIYGMDYDSHIVSVLFLGEEYVADVIDNAFSIALPAMKAGGPYEIRVSGSSNITISDVYFGDVYWLAGQSNMELPIKRVLDVSGDEIKTTNEALIRQFLMPASFDFDKEHDFMIESNWRKATGEDLLNFSALGFFFAKEIKEAKDIPVGLVMTAVGGSKIESWMRPETLETFGGDYQKEIKEFKDINYFNQFISGQQMNANEWLNEIHKNEKVDCTDYKTWDKCKLPFFVSELGLTPFAGSIYVIKELYIDNESNLDDGFLYMGTIIDSDQVYINDVLIGRTEYRYPPRKYDIPKGVLKVGLNLIKIRMVINHQDGGMIKGRPYYIRYNNKQVSLEGEWFYKIGYQAKTTMPPVLFPPLLPICFYNTVVVPLKNIRFKGMLWYQGESNTGSPNDYYDKFLAMVGDIRELFGYELPILTVQLTNYSEPLSKIYDTGWAMIREQQRKALDIKQVGMAVTYDIGEWNDLHPQNKKEMAIRLSLVARKLIYKEDIEYSGPLPKNIINRDTYLEIEFSHLDPFKEKVELYGFEVAGENSEFINVPAYGEGDKVYVCCDNIKEIRQVRYNWMDNPTNHFYNNAGLPASGFLLSI